jgi:hypothetical protein
MEFQLKYQRRKMQKRKRKKMKKKKVNIFFLKYG